MIYLINYIIETLLLNWIYFCVSAGIAMFLASVAETVYSYLQVSFRLVQRWVMPDVIARIKKVVDKTLTPSPWTAHMQGRSSHMHIRPCVHVELKFWKNTHIIYVLFSEKVFFMIKSGWLIHFLLGVFCFLCFTSAVSDKLYYTEDETFFARANILMLNEKMCLLNSTFVFN